MRRDPSQAGYWHRTLLPVAGPTAEHTARHAGENRIWVAMNHLYLAVLTDDRRRAEVVRDAFVAECQVQEGEGIKEDYSFHQHGPLLYTGGYGAGLLRGRGEVRLDHARHALSAPEGGPRGLRPVRPGRRGVVHLRELLRSLGAGPRDHPRGRRAAAGAALAAGAGERVEPAARGGDLRLAKSFHRLVPSYRLRTAPLWSADRGYAHRGLPAHGPPALLGVRLHGAPRRELLRLAADVLGPHEGGGDDQRRGPELLAPVRRPALGLPARRRLRHARRAADAGLAAPAGDDGRAPAAEAGRGLSRAGRRRRRTAPSSAGPSPRIAACRRWSWPRRCRPSPRRRAGSSSATRSSAWAATSTARATTRRRPS